MNRIPTPLPLGPARPAPAEPALRSPLPASDEELATQCVLDTAARAATATFIYPGLWLAIAYTTELLSRWPLTVGASIAALGLLALVRYHLHQALPAWLRRQRGLAEAWFKGLSVLTAASWGTLTAGCLLWVPGEPAAWTMMAVSVGMCAAANTMLGFNRALRWRWPAALLLPMVLAQLANPTRDHLMMLALEAIFLTYLLRSSRIVHEDYWCGRHARQLAERQARDLERASLTDPLTRLHNRMLFDRSLAHEWARHRRSRMPLSVLVVDLDHFKNVNDSFGHPFGDTCLRATAQALRAACQRDSDVVARYGGEEFVVLLPDTDSAGALAVAEQLLQGVRDLVLDADGLSVRVTCSIGVASARPGAMDRAQDLVQRADAALYTAKREGRNRACLAPAPSEA